MMKFTFKVIKLFVLFLVIIKFNANDLQEDEKGEVEYIKIKTLPQQKFQFDYYRYNDKTKSYSIIQSINDFECNLNKNKKNSVVHFQVSNDQRQVVLQGEQRQTNQDDSIIKIPLVNVLKKNIFMNAFCQNYQVDLYIYNFDHEFEGEYNIIYLKRVRNNFQPQQYSGYSYELFKLDLATKQFQQEENLNKSFLCRPQNPVSYKQPFKFEFYVISGDGKITSRIKRVVKPDINLNLLPFIINAMDNRIPFCFQYQNNDNVKIVMRNMKNKKIGNEHEDYSLFQFRLNILDDKAHGYVQSLDETNKEKLVAQCSLQGLEFFRENTDFEFKYIFIKGKKLQTEFSSQSRENTDLEISDIMFIAPPYINDLQSINLDCKLHFLQDKKNKKVYGYFYLKENEQVIDEYIKEEVKIKKKEMNQNYNQLLESLGEKMQEIVDQKILEDQEQENKQQEIQEEGLQEDLFEEFSDQEQERESESIQQDSESEKATKQRLQYRVDRYNKMQQLLKKFNINQEQNKVTSIPQNMTKPVAQKPVQNLAFNFQPLKKDQQFDSSDEAIQKLKRQQNEFKMDKQQSNFRKFRQQQFIRQNKFQTKKNDEDSSDDQFSRRQRFKIDLTEKKQQRPLQILKINNEHIQKNKDLKNSLDRKIQDIRMKRFVPSQQSKIQQNFLNFNQPLNLNDFKHKMNLERPQQVSRENRFDRQTQDNDQEKKRSQSISPKPFKIGKGKVFTSDYSKFTKQEKLNILRQKLKQLQEKSSEQEKNIKRRIFNTFREKLLKPSKTDDILEEQQKKQVTEKPKITIKLKRRNISPEMRQKIQNLRNKIGHENKWSVVLEQQKLHIKQISHNLQNEQINDFACRPFIQDHQEKLDNLSEKQLENIHFKWINEETIFERQIEWEKQGAKHVKGTWENQLPISLSEFILRNKLYQKHQYCMYKVHKDYLEIMFIRHFSNVTYHQAEIKDNILKYEIYDNLTRIKLLECQDTINNAKRIPIVQAYFTDFFGITNELDQKMITLTKLSRKFLAYDKDNLIFKKKQIFCVIDQGNYEFKQKISLRTFEIPDTQSFQFVEAYFKDYNVNIFNLHYGQNKPNYKVQKYNLQSEVKNADLETLFYTINTYVNQNITSKTNLVQNGYKVRLPYLLKEDSEPERLVTLKANQFKNNNFLYITLIPQNYDLQVLRSGLFLTSNYQLNYFMINDHNNTVLQKTLERNKEIDDFIRVRQTNNQHFLYKNVLKFQNPLTNETELFEIHTDPMRLLEGYFMETNFYDDLPRNYEMVLDEAKVKLQSFSINIEQSLRLKNII